MWTRSQVREQPFASIRVNYQEIRNRSKLPCVQLSRSFAHKQIVRTLWYACGVTLFSVSSTAQSVAPTIDEVRQAIKPITEPVVGFSYYVSMVWHYISVYTSLAILLSAFLASLFAYLSMRNQRNITRLRETFATINDDNWDKDVILAREVFSKIKQEIGSETHKITKYCDPPSDPSITNEVVTLHTILNDYENLALGVRHNIVDEEFLYRWMRGALLEDWAALSPLVSAYRGRRKNSSVYIEFEGLAASWVESRSYRTGKKLKRARKLIRIN